MRHVALLIGMLSVLCVVRAQPKYGVQGTFQGKSAQGMAVFGNNAFLLNNTGLCRSFDLKGKELKYNFKLTCFSDKNHANCASFGSEKLKNKPLLYISQCCAPTFYCYVESVGDDGSELVQTIALNCSGENGVAHDWIVDKRANMIYTVTTAEILDEKTGLRRFHIVKFRLPKISAGKNVVLNDRDVLEDFNIEYPNILQGGTIKGRYLYLPMGVGKEQKNGNLGRNLVVVDLKKRQIVRTVNIDDYINNEPEDCDFYKGKLLLYCGQSGGLYEIPTK
ncbi:MAG: hypothetical protein IJ190_09410 [Prevotella sp.]|nr:hypothetical protein [Prevotella sp.]